MAPITRTVDLTDIKVFVREQGSGTPVLLWHGFLETGRCWDEVAAALSRDFRVIVPDMRGYGDSAKPRDSYDARTLYKDFRQLLQAIDIDLPVHLVAHDMGAPPALLWAGECPDEVASVTYVEEPLATHEALSALFRFDRNTFAMGGLWWWGLGLAPDAPERLLPGNERAFLTWFYDHYTSKRAAITDEVVEEHLRTFSGPEGIAGAFGVYRAIFDTVAQTEALKRLDVPVLAVGGEKSLGTKVGEMLRPLCDNLLVEEIAGAGHFVPLEQPEALAELVREFIRNC